MASIVGASGFVGATVRDVDARDVRVDGIEQYNNPTITETCKKLCEES